MSKKVYTKDGLYVCQKCKDDTYDEARKDDYTIPATCDICGDLLID